MSLLQHISIQQLFSENKARNFNKICQVSVGVFTLLKA